jgi:hypothetical protein
MSGDLQIMVAGIWSVVSSNEVRREPIYQPENQQARKELHTLVIRCSLSVECPIQMICLIKRSDDSNSSSVSLSKSASHLMSPRRLTEVAKEPVLQTVITFNPFFPPPLFSHNHSAPLFPISIHLAKSSPWTALHVSRIFPLSSSPEV